jgi:hypothetical protein
MQTISKLKVVSSKKHVTDNAQKSKFLIPPCKYAHMHIQFLHIPCTLILSKLFSPTDAQVNCLTNNFKIYIRIDIKTAPTCFDAVTPSSASTLLVQFTCASVGEENFDAQTSLITLNEALLKMENFNNQNNIKIIL